MSDMNVSNQDPVQYKTIALNTSLTKGVQLYRPVVVTGAPKEIEQTAQDLADLGCNVDATTIKYVLEFFRDNVTKLMAKDGGRPRRIGNLATLRVCIFGSLKTPDAALDANENPICVIAQTDRNVRNALKDATTQNVSDGIPAKITGCRDNTLGKDEQLAGKDVLEINGKMLNLVEGRNDEFVALDKEDGVTEVARFTVDVNQPNRLNAHLTATQAEGKYKLVVQTRGGQDAALGVVKIVRPLTIVKPICTSVIDSMVHVATNVRDEIHGTGAVLLAGKNLMISAENADEGVWIEKTDGTKVCGMKVVEDHLDTLTVQAETADLPAGDCYVVVATRGGGAPAEVDLATLKHAAKIVAD